MTIEELERAGAQADVNAQQTAAEEFGANRRTTTVAMWMLVRVMADIAVQMHRIGDFAKVIRADYEKDHSAVGQDQ